MDETKEADADASTLFELSPEEDSGSATQDNYAWQHHCTAIDLLRMLDDGERIIRVVCEFHEDYVIEFEAEHELVSCKHRDQNQGPWRLSDLCAKGGLAHLFSRLTATNVARLRLLTNQALQPGALKATGVIEACVRLRDGCAEQDVVLEVDAMASALLAANKKGRFEGIPVVPIKRGRPEHVPTDFIPKVVDFMKRLVVRAEMPSRRFIKEHLVETHLRPHVSKPGQPEADVPECYTGLMSLVAERNRSDALTERVGEWLTGKQNEGQRGTLAALVSARSIYPDEVRSRIAKTLAPVPSLRRFKTSGHERLQAKLRAGGVGPTRRSAAERLREAWLYQWAETKTGLPGDEGRREDIEARVLAIVGEAEAVARGLGTPWGDALLDELQARFSASDARTALGMEELMLMGVAFDLASQCDVWFSEEFSLENATGGEGGTTR